MIDLHCHLLPGLDDGAPDMAAALSMATTLARLGFTAVAASPHLGSGPGGDVPPERASEVRDELSEALRRDKIDLALLPNAEHHLLPDLYSRIEHGGIVPVASSRWLLVELPWGGLSNLEDALFRLQAKGFKLLLAHPERYDFLELATLARLVARGVRVQLELASFADVFGLAARERAEAAVRAGLAHVFATDLHRPAHAEAGLKAACQAVEQSFGKAALVAATRDNPQRIVDDLAVEAIVSTSEA